MYSTINIKKDLLHGDVDEKSKYVDVPLWNIYGLLAFCRCSVWPRVLVFAAILIEQSVQPQLWSYSYHLYTGLADCLYSPVFSHDNISSRACHLSYNGCLWDFASDPPTVYTYMLQHSHSRLVRWLGTSVGHMYWQNWTQMPLLISYKHLLFVSLVMIVPEASITICT